MTTDNRTNKPTPNPTAEQIVAAALNRIDLYADELPKAVVSALHAHNLLSEGAPSEVAKFEEGFKTAAGWILTGTKDPDEVLSAYRGHLRALEARRVHDEEWDPEARTRSK